MLGRTLGFQSLLTHLHNAEKGFGDVFNAVESPLLVRDGSSKLRQGFGPVGPVVS